MEFDLNNIVIFGHHLDSVDLVGVAIFAFNVAVYTFLAIKGYVPEDIEEEDDARKRNSLYELNDPGLLLAQGRNPHSGLPIGSDPLTLPPGPKYT